jgi:hypothetical protein
MTGANRRQEAAGHPRPNARRRDSQHRGYLRGSEVLPDHVDTFLNCL